MQDLPDFEFSDELENEFEKMKAEQENTAANAQAADAAAGQIADPASMPAATPSDETEFFAWQVCIADTATNSLANADDFPSYMINREPITQMLGIGMASGQNAYPLEDQMFVVAISVQDNGEIRLIGPDHPRYREVAAVVSEELLKNQDKGMVAALPNGQMIAVKAPVDPTKL